MTPSPGAAPECLRCQEPMIRGFQFDHGDYGHTTVSRWVEGEPQRSWLSGEVKHAQTKAGLPITVFRCPTCGYLESYAS